MNSSIDVNAIKAYNQSLKEFQDKAVKLRAEIEYGTKEINRLCEELSNELGIQVTPENIESIRDEHVGKLNNALLVGNEIIERLRQQESVGINPGVNMGSGQMIGVAPGVGPGVAHGAMTQSAGYGAQTVPQAWVPDKCAPQGGAQSNNMQSMFGGIDI